MTQELATGPALPASEIRTERDGFVHLEFTKKSSPVH
jgi:hypothetical protein